MRKQSVYGGDYDYLSLKELSDALLKMLADGADPNAEVGMQGCDCDGTCAGADYDAEKKEVYLCR